MSVSAVSNPAPSASQYDFSDMTAKQEIAAAGELAQEGKITGDQFAIFAGEALSFSPAGGVVPGSANDPLASSTKQNFVQMLQEEITDL